MMVALSPGLCNLFSGAALQLPCVIATGRGKPQVQPCPQCPESDGWPSKWCPSRWARTGPRPSALRPLENCFKCYSLHKRPCEFQLGISQRSDGSLLLGVAGEVCKRAGMNIETED